MNDIFLRYPGGLERAVTFSYDDSNLTNMKLADIFNKYKAKCTFNLNSGFFTNEDVAGKYTYMKKSDVKELFKGTEHEAAIHGYTHPFFDLLPDGLTAYEIIKDRETLEDMFGKPVKGMAFPNGPVTADAQYSEKITQLLKNCGICYARTTLKANNFRLPDDWYRLRTTCHHNSPELMSTARLFAETDIDRIPRLFYVWGHSFEFERNGNWNVMEELLKYLSGFDNIWYATNMEIYNYVRAYNSLQFDVKGTMAYNPSCVSVYVTRKGKTKEIKPGETAFLNDE